MLPSFPKGMELKVKVELRAVWLVESPHVGNKAIDGYEIEFLFK
ncbi:MAG: hypothetical protein ACTS73_05070 [Arsenophonus sp. NEOnobi-MAG3]